jgi:hypothetical protein
MRSSWANIFAVSFDIPVLTVVLRVREGTRPMAYEYNDAGYRSVPRPSVLPNAIAENETDDHAYQSICLSRAAKRKGQVTVMNLALTTALIGETPERHAVIKPTYAMHHRSYSRTIGPQSFPRLAGTTSKIHCTMSATTQTK